MRAASIGCGKFGLYPIDEKRTQLVSLGLKHRAEALRVKGVGETRARQRPAA